MTTQPLVVWTELPVRDVASAAAFYDAGFDDIELVTLAGAKKAKAHGEAA